MGLKILWLIDGSYLYKCMKAFSKEHPEYSKGGFDYKKLKSQVKSTISDINENDGVSRIMPIYFNSTPNPAKDSQNKFHTWLKTAEPDGPAISVKLYGLKEKSYHCSNCNNCGSQKIQKGVDVGIATAALKYYERYDGIALSAGDGDFADFVQFISEEKGKDIYLFGFKGSISSDIQQYARSVTYLDDIYGKIYDDRAETVPFDEADDVE